MSWRLARLNGSILVPFYDAYGNVMGYRDEQGNVVAEYAYSAGIRGRRKYSWTTEMYIEDVLATQPGDRLRNIPGVAAVTPSRKVKRAQWTLSGSGECCARREGR